MSTVTQIFRCGYCKQAGYPFDLALHGDWALLPSIAVRVCDACQARVVDELARVRPVFDTMLLVGVSRDLANATMSFLLQRLDDVAPPFLDVEDT